VLKELVLIDVENLETAQTGVLLDHLVADVHRLVVGVAHACLNIADVECLLPSREPVTIWESSAVGNLKSITLLGELSRS